MVHFDELIRELMNFRCNVLTENNRFLFFGRIAYYDDVNQLIRVENYYYPTLRKSFYKDTPSTSSRTWIPGGISGRMSCRRP